MHRLRIHFRATVLSFVLFAAAPATAWTQPHPAEVFGFEPGADHRLADYSQVREYFRLLAEASDRVEVVEIGRSVLDRPLLLAYISSEANLRELDRWRGIAERLARAHDLDDEEARRLAAEGRAVVWIDGGLHATEVAHAQHTPVLAYEVATAETEEMRRIRDDVVLLLMPVMNPDGLDMVVDWYRGNLGTEYETAPLPWLYHHYTGHDNNRDWFMITQPETEAVSRVLYREWYPQIVYNHHQTAPFPARIFVPPFADPVNPHIPPLVVSGVNLVGDAMARRFAREGKPGVVSRMSFTMWWNGGMRTAPYFHNMVGILTETALYRYATPRYYEPDSLPQAFGRGSHRIPAREPTIFHADPWQGGWWRLADAMDYMMTASMAVLDIGSRLREDWLYDIYRMGRAAIEAGRAGGPYAYLVPPEQWDGGEAVELVNVLGRGGVERYRSLAPFEADGRVHPAGTYVIPAAQAFRPYVMDLLEPQRHPHRELYPDGPPEPPYGNLAGWTLPYQMGVRVDRIEAPFAAELEPVVDAAAPPAGRVVGTSDHGYVLAARQNAAYTAVNRLLRRGERVGRADLDGPGAFVIEAGPRTRPLLEALAAELGLEFRALDGPPGAGVRALRAPRVALYKSWLANIDEGWTRWVLERHEFPVDTVFDEDVRAGRLAAYDVLILPHQNADSILHGRAPGSMPARFVGGLGEAGAAAIRDFVRAGGTLVTMDASGDFAIRHLDLPVRNAVAGLERSRFYVPGSVVRITVDPAHPVGYGVPAEAAAFFAGSAAFEVDDPPALAGGSAPSPGAGTPEVVARYGTDEILLSGWELGAAEHLAGRPAVVRVPVGQGHAVLIGFRPQFRGQPRGTFKFVFNALYDAATAAPAEAAAGGGAR